jgi:hypothetical protein
MDKQRSTKHTHITKDRVTRTPLQTASDTRRVNLVTHPVISHECGTLDIFCQQEVKLIFPVLHN